jgi:hypothetical protein
MSLPSGLLFYLDYTYGSDVGGDSSQSGTNLTGTNVTYEQGQSLYNNPPGSGVRSGSLAVGGHYDLVGTSYTQQHATAVLGAGDCIMFSGSFGGGSAQVAANAVRATTSGSDGKLLQFDPQIVQLIEEDNPHTFLIVAANVLSSSNSVRMDQTAVKSLALYDAGSGQSALASLGDSVQGGSGIKNVRRLNQLGTWNSTTSKFTVNALKPLTDADAGVLCVVSGTYAGSIAATSTNFQYLTASFVISDSVSAAGGTGGTLTIPSFESDFAATPSPVIPEIDIKIESIAVTATTRKLRARWSPELAQDLNAYHSLDAEVELTQILSEQIALEIDREILNDLLVEAAGANYYWSRSPGKFVNKNSGAAATLASTLATGPQFTGTVREWYETLVETIIDVANEIHRKTLRGSANFIVVSPEVATIFEASVLYKPTIKLDGDGQVSAPFSLGAAAIGSLSNRFTVYKDPYFPRNKVLVGYKGGSYLETGYVYAPYVPLIVTPTIFAPEDFTPRKGVMTRYGKKMVRADFYGTVTVMDMDII